MYIYTYIIYVYIYIYIYIYTNYVIIFFLVYNKGR